MASPLNVARLETSFIEDNTYARVATVGTLRAASIQSGVTETDTSLNTITLVTTTDITLPSFTALGMTYNSLLIITVVNTDVAAITVTSPTNTVSVAANTAQPIALYAYSGTTYKIL